MADYTATEKYRCAKRELGQREHVYPRRIEAGKMTRRLADREIALMKEIMADYRAAAIAAGEDPEATARRRADDQQGLDL